MCAAAAAAAAPPPPPPRAGRRRRAAAAAAAAPQQPRREMECAASGTPGFAARAAPDPLPLGLVLIIGARNVQVLLPSAQVGSPPRRHAARCAAAAPPPPPLPLPLDAAAARAGTSCFLGGISVVLLGWPVIGMCVEVYGFVVLFGDFFPVVIGFLRNLPVIGTLLSLPGISSALDSAAGKARLPV